MPKCPGIPEHALPEPVEPWSPPSLREKLIKIGAKVVDRGRYIALQMAEVAVSRKPLLSDRIFRSDISLI